LIDTDALVVATVGKTVSEIFIEDGEPAFREHERRAVQEALTHDDAVVALGGGSVMDPQRAAAITASGAPVIFLDVSIASAAPRIGFNRDRPLLVGNPRAQWMALMEKRRPIYSALATMTVSTEERAPEQVADEIVRNWKRS
jgi:shikimate kinase